MKFSRRGCYTFRALLELAQNYKKGPVMMSTISQKHDISRKYLHALLTALKTAGLVRSVRGSSGGYILARSPAEISLSDVVRVLEGSLALSDCVEDSTLCKEACRCPTRPIWEKISQTIEQMLAAVSIADLLERQRETEQKAFDYQI